MAIGSYAESSEKLTDCCYHCGEPIEKGVDIQREIEDSAQQKEVQKFCCHGCLAVCDLIYSGGLQAYYQNRDNFADKVSQAGKEFGEFDDTDFQKSFCTLSEDGVQRSKFFIDGIHCSACVWLIEKSLNKLDGIQQSRVSLLDSALELEWQSDTIALSKILSQIERLGYHPALWLENENKSRQQQHLKTLLRRTGLAGLLMMQVGMFSIALYAGKGREMAIEYQQLLQGFSLLLASCSLIFAGRSFFNSAWSSLRALQINMDVPISCALLAAWIGSAIATFRAAGEVYFDSICMFIFLLNAIRYFELKSRLRHSSIDNQIELPEHCRVLKSNSLTDFGFVSALEIKPGQHILVKRGEILALDGYLLSEHALVNEANINGEFLPVDKHRGDALLSGAINESEHFVYCVSKTADQSCMQNIQNRASALRSERPRFLSLSDSIAAWFSSFVLIASTLAALTWMVVDSSKSLEVFIAMLVISCPCALSLAAPSAIAVSANFLRKHGVLIARAAAFERLPKIDSLCLDKTGTLTEGVFSLTGKVHYPDSTLANKDEIDNLACCLQHYSEHPIAKVFQTFSTPEKLENLSGVANIKSHVAKGVSAEWQGQEWRIGNAEFCQALCRQALGFSNTRDSATRVYLVSAQHCYACYKLEDRLRDNADNALAALPTLDKSILSGDHTTAVEQIADKLKIQKWRGNCKPDDKQAYIAAQQKEGKKVAMLGDGVNDLPVLAQADISIAMHNGNRLAQVEADCILLDNKLESVFTLFKHAHKTLRIIKQNYFWALLYNTSALPLAALGLIPPWLAALGMSLSSLLVVLNASRLNRAN